MRSYHQRKNVNPPIDLSSIIDLFSRNARRNWNEERRVNAETFGLKYRPIQQGGNQRSNNYRRNPNTRYQRTNNGGYGNRNAMYYGNFNSRVRAY